MNRKIIKVDNLKLSYIVRETDGPKLVLIPGSFSDASQWENVVPALDPNFHLFLFEVRGHGKSWPPPQNGTVEQLAQDILAVTDAEGLDNFYVGGHSIGGMIAKEVGRQWQHKIAGVISIEGWTHYTVAKNAFQNDMYSTLTEEENLKRLNYRKRGAGHWSEEQRMDFGPIWRKWERGNEFLNSTSLPVLELYGDRGKPKPTREQVQIPNRENITLRWINNASHSLPLEEPIAVGNAISDFIRQNEKTNN